MTHEIRLRRTGGSVTATLPKELVARYHLEPGDEMMAVETADGILLTPYDPDLAESLAVARRGARKYRNALRELAK